jgi:hypothetical protein
MFIPFEPRGAARYWQVLVVSVEIAREETGLPFHIAETKPLFETAYAWGHRFLSLAPPEFAA